MLKYSEAEVLDELRKNNIFPNGKLFISYDSHNISITDKSSFFIKVLGDTNSLHSFTLEKEASTLFEKAPKLLRHDTISIFSKQATVWEYIDGHVPSFKDITKQHMFEVVDQLHAIRKTPRNAFTKVQGLEQSVATIERRLSSEKALNLPVSLQKDLRTLVDTFVLPTVHSGLQRLFVCHADMHLGNVMFLRNGDVKLIDYESLKYTPLEYDLACLYQQLIQTENQKTIYSYALEAYEETVKVDYEVLNKLILLRNVSTTTYTIAFGKKDIVVDRTMALMNSIKTGVPPENIKALY